MTVSNPLYELRYELRLDAPALVTTIAGDPNTVTGESFLPGGSILGAFAGRWIQVHGLRGNAHQDVTFAHLFLRGGLTFLNALPQDPAEANVRMLPAPLSMWRPKQDEAQGYDLCAEDAEDADRRLSGFCGIADHTIRTHEPKMRLRLHTARADRLVGRPTETAGALFAYEALDGGQTFLGGVLGSAADLQEVVSRLGWAGEPLTFALGRSRSAEYGGQARLRLSSPAPQPFSGEIAQRQEPDDGLVLTLTASLVAGPESVDPASGRLTFPYAALAAALCQAGVPTTTEALQTRCRAFTRAVTVGGYSGVWAMPRPQLPAFAAGSVFHFSAVQGGADSRALYLAEQHALGSRMAEGYGRFVLNWHGEIARYTVQRAKRTENQLPPASPMPSTFKHVALDVARAWAADTVRTEALHAAQEAHRNSKAPSPAQLRRVGDLLRTLTPTNAGEARARLLAYRPVARQQLDRCIVSGKPLSDRLLLLCSPELPEQRDALRALLRLHDPPRPLLPLLQEAGHAGALDAPEQLGVLASLFGQALCAELARLQRRRGEG